MTEAPPTVALIAGQVSRRGEVRRLAHLVDRLAHRRVAALVVCSGGAADLQELGVPVLEDPWLDRSWLRRIAVRRLLLDESDPRPCLIHVLHDEVADTASALARSRQLPLIRTIEDDPPPELPLRLNFPGLAALVVSDEGLAHRLSRRSPLARDLIRVIPPGIEVLPRTAAHPEANPSDRLPVIGAIGRFGPCSGFETFLDAVHRVVETGRDVEFLIAGLGPGEARLRRRAGRLELADRLTFAPPSALEAAFWQVITIYCHPSASATSAGPLRSAMVAGTPCIATQVPGPRELLDDSRGVLVPPSDPSSLASAMLDLLDHPTRSRSLADRARSWAVPLFNPDHEADALASLYYSLASSFPSP